MRWSLGRETGGRADARNVARGRETFAQPGFRTTASRDVAATERSGVSSDSACATKGYGGHRPPLQ
jgi:hypothetical protein